MHIVNDNKNNAGNNDNSNLISNAADHRVLIIGLASILIGIGCFSANMYTYPYLLPRVLTSENSNVILLQSYIFYAVFFASAMLIALGSRKLYHAAKEGERRSLIDGSSLHRRLLLLLASFVRVIANVFDDRRFVKMFWITTGCYGIFYAIVSNTIIFRPGGLLEHGTQLTIPSSLIMQYGPAGYAPAIAVTLTENIGFLIVPFNLSLLLLTSVMVGLNVALSIFSINHTKKLTKSSFLGSMGASTALFSVCPTCASFFVISAIAGPLALTISAFTASFYLLFSIISVPSLIAGAIITATGIHRMTIKSSSNSCSVSFGNTKI